ncbi:hypothetical protein LDENG_00131060 [Lucifuga dentata]|nr:hypothetical protein LDENG_00131060 [Lucifuga dentata]
MDLASNIPHLVETHTLRDQVHKMPLLSPHLLSSHRELRLAHLALGFITAGYVWQEGQHAPAQILPKALALPFRLVSHKLGLPPILNYAAGVVANWKLRDPIGDMEIGNLDVIFSLPGGESCRGFFIVSLLVEMAASSGITGALEVMHAVKVCDLLRIQEGLFKVAQSLKQMRETFTLMHKHVVPTEFYGTLRVFLTGWRDNPLLPHGLLYEGVSNEPIMLAGGSAAQSSAIQCFDALLNIHHEDDAGAFLTRMRDYMPPVHQQLIDALSVSPSLRDFIMSSSSPDLCQAYNSCVSALVDLRNYHLSIVAKYIIVPSNTAPNMGCPFRDVDITGTGGSNLMVFLKNVRDTTQKALMSEVNSI